jgi:hypothetical protein
MTLYERLRAWGRARRLAAAIRVVAAARVAHLDAYYQTLPPVGAPMPPDRARATQAASARFLTEFVRAVGGLYAQSHPLVPGAVAVSIWEGGVLLPATSAALYEAIVRHLREATEDPGSPDPGALN